MVEEEPTHGGLRSVAVLVCVLAGCIVSTAGCASVQGPSTEPSDSPRLVGHAPGEEASDDAEAGEDAERRETAEQSQPPEDADRSRDLWYRIECSGHALRVRLRLLSPPTQAHFFLPNASGRKGRLGDRFQVSYVRGPERRRSYRVRRDRGRIDVEAGGARWIELVYRVRFGTVESETGLPGPQVSRGTLLAYAPTFLIVPSRDVVRPIRDVPVEVHAPASWRLLSTWRRRETKPSAGDGDRRVYGFVPRDFRRLRDAFLVGGPRLDVRRRERGERRIDVAFEPSFGPYAKETTDTIARIVGRLRDRFGATGPVSVYVRTRSAERDVHRRGTSRRGGFVVSLPSHQPLASRDALLVAHEAFHLWNGHALVPAPGSARSTRWFMEGVTQYVALETVRRLGLLSMEGALDELARSASAYVRNPAARDARASRFDRRRLPYDRGVLLALALDAALWRTSDGAVDLETWLRTMLSAKHGTRRFYTLEELKRALRQTSHRPRDVLKLWRRHVERQVPLDPHALFRSIGLTFASGVRAELEPMPPSRAPSTLYRTLLAGSESTERHETLDASTSTRSPRAHTTRHE